MQFRHNMQYFTVYPDLNMNIVIISKHFFFKEDCYWRKFGESEGIAMQVLLWKFLMGGRVDCTDDPQAVLVTPSTQHSQDSQRISRCLTIGNK